MTADQCSVCETTVDPDDGAPGCACAPRAAQDALAAFDAFRPKQLSRPEFSARPVFTERTAESEPTGNADRDPDPDPVPEGELVQDPDSEPYDDGDSGTGRRRKGAVIGAAAAVFGLVAILFTTGMMGEESRTDDDGSALPTPVFSGAPAPEGEERLESGPPQDTSHAGPRTASPPKSASGGARQPGGQDDQDGIGSPEQGGAPGTSTQGGGSATDPGSPSDPGQDPPDGGQDEPPVLRRGDKGPEVAKLQHLLKQDPEDGIYDRALENRVRRFQRDHGIEDDPPGVYGPSTRQLLESMDSPRPGGR